MANYRFPMLLALSISAAGALALTARPVISQTPTPALKSDCLTDLAHVEEAIEAERAKWFHAIEGGAYCPAPWTTWLIACGTSNPRSILAPCESDLPPGWNSPARLVTKSCPRVAPSSESGCKKLLRRSRTQYHAPQSRGGRPVRQDCRATQSRSPFRVRLGRGRCR